MQERPPPRLLGPPRRQHVTHAASTPATAWWEALTLQRPPRVSAPPEASVCSQCPELVSASGRRFSRGCGQGPGRCQPRLCFKTTLGHWGSAQPDSSVLFPCNRNRRGATCCRRRLSSKTRDK